jgi:hypothetical protein
LCRILGANASRLARFFTGVLRKHGSVFEMHPSNSQFRPGLLTFHNRQLASVVSVSIEGDRIAAIYSVNNPDKILR